MSVLSGSVQNIPGLVVAARPGCPEQSEQPGSPPSAILYLQKIQNPRNPEPPGIPARFTLLSAGVARSEALKLDLIRENPFAVKGKIAGPYRGCHRFGQ